MQRGASGLRTPVVTSDRSIRTPEEMLDTAQQALAAAAQWSHPGEEGPHRRDGFKPAADGLRWLCRFLVEHRASPVENANAEAITPVQPSQSTPASGNAQAQLSDPRD